jgi:hypothetical protein
MSKHLQIEFDVDVNGDLKDEAKLTPIDLPIPDDLAAHIQEAIAIGDLGDAQPGDGELEERQHVKVPIKLFFVNLNVSADVTAKLRVVDK